MPNTTLLEQLIDRGIEPIIKKDKQTGEIYYDLQSGMKSQMYLYLDPTGGDTHKIKLRYNEEKLVEDLWDVLHTARYAMHGRDSASYFWHDFMKEF